MRTRTIGLLVVAAVVLAAGCSSYQPLTEPASTLPPGVELSDEGDYLALSPSGGVDGDDSAGAAAPQGIIFYPGGLVEPEAYVSMLAPLAADGTPVAILRVPADLAVFSPNRATRVIESGFGAAARTWVVAGHSLGGAMAARFAARTAGDYPSVRGLILLAAYPAQSDSLAGRDVPVLSIWASEDGLATAEDRRETADRLPEGARVVVIEGGNHAGFGEYGPQDDDGEATIPREAQHERVRDVIMGFIGSIDDR
ncbi:MAG: alpha/beta hydrolase [Spirochaetota bacterium]